MTHEQSPQGAQGYGYVPQQQAPAQAPPQAPPQQAPAQAPPQAPPQQAPPQQAPPQSPPNEPQVIQTDSEAQDGLVKCLQCGATEIALNPSSGKLRCAFCRYEWAAETLSESLNLSSDIGSLQGVMIGSGAADITPSTEEVLTFNCSACGADVAIDTASST